MRLIYVANRQEVKMGDTVKVDGNLFTVNYFRPPHSTASSGKVTIQPLAGGSTREYYVSVIGAEWIEREDREEEDRHNGLVDFGPRGVTDHGDSVDGPDIQIPEGMRVVKLRGKNRSLIRKYEYTQHRETDDMVAKNLTFRELLEQNDFGDGEVDRMMDLKEGQEIIFDQGHPTEYHVKRTA